MPNTFIDSHAHLYVDQFESDLSDVVKRSLAADVTKVLLPNIDVESIDKMFAICDLHPDFFHPMIGLHPCSVTANYLNDLQILHARLDDERVIAVGEIGTDLYWDKTNLVDQTHAFEIQCDWALERNLPIVIHCRDSMDITIDLVKEKQNGNLKGVFHCFGGTLDQARAIMDLGFLIGIGGVSTFKKSVPLREALGSIPLSSLLLETDSPYLSPHPYRGKRNESSYIPLIAEVVANSKEVSISAVADQTTINAKALFNL